MGLLASDDTDCFIGNVGSSVFGSMTLGQRDKMDLPLPKKSTYGNGQCSGPAVFSILTFSLSKHDRSTLHSELKSIYTCVSLIIYFCKKKRYLLSIYRFVAEL